MKIKKNSKEMLIISAFLEWYKINKRDLPWRKLKKNKLPNPYFTLVSEFMLQQTTVNTVIKRFNEFIDIWPTCNHLSKITENKILKFWSGLGYYNRARNLLKTIKIISRDYNSRIPRKYEDLIRLPGIGDYTAKAIQGIAYNDSVMPLDANIERIITRLYNIQIPIISSKKEIQLIANKFKSSNNATNLIQSFMDYGSMICIPRNPRCNFCIISKYCQAKKLKLQNSIPLKKNSKEKKMIKFTRAYIIENKSGEILIRRRKSKGMLASMLEIPNDEWVEDKKLLKRDPLYMKIDEKFLYKGNLTYSFSHFDLEIAIYKIFIKKQNYYGCKLLKSNKINSSGLPTIMKQIIKKVYY